MRRGLALVISAPSGAGKTTLCRRLLEEEEDVTFSVSYTTRSPRPGEVHGRDYFFVSRDEFEARRNRGDFLEWAEVHGNLYGTSREQVLTVLAGGRDVLLDIDVQGAFQVRERLGRDAVLVFVLPPSLEELERRLRGRSTEEEDVVRRRLEAARRELACAAEFDYVVLNDDLEAAFVDLVSVLRAERQRPFRREDLLERF